jgi:hypothetical protein
MSKMVQEHMEWIILREFLGRDNWGNLDSTYKG